MLTALPYLAGGLGAAGCAIWALIERLRAQRAQAIAASALAKFARAAADAERTADLARTDRLTWVDLRERLERVVWHKDQRLKELTDEREKLVRVLMAIDPAAAALAVGSVLDGVLQAPPGGTGGGGSGPVLAATAAPWTNPAKGR